MASTSINDNSSDDFEDSKNRLIEFLNQPVFNSYCTVKDLLPTQDLLFHPAQYFSTLIRIDYEPLPPKLTKSIFGRTRLALPGFFTYMNYITQIDGFFGLYRGLRYHYIFTVANRFTSINVSHYQKDNYFPQLKDSEAKYKDLNNLASSIFCDCVTATASAIVAYPFHLIMVRSMTQFIGRETYYDSLHGAMNDILLNGGFAGFYAGFMPFLVGECTFIILQSTLMYIFKKGSEEMGQKPNVFYLEHLAKLISRTFSFPFQKVSTVMSVNGKQNRSLAASAYTAPEYTDWVECMKTLWNRGQLSQGSSFFFRYRPINSQSSLQINPLILSNRNMKPM